MMLSSLVWSLCLQAGAVEQETAPTKPDGVVRVMQFNIWQEGTSVDGGFDKIVDVIVASQADVVALSEVRNYQGADLHERLLAALRQKGEAFHGRYGGGDVGVLSRWPIDKAELIVDGRQIARGSIVAFHLRIDAEPLVICSAHLDYKNYATYLPRGYDGNSFEMIDEDGDGEPDPVTDVKKLHRMDQASARDDALRAFLKYVKQNRMARCPVVLAGDFNECSHLDWTAATRDHWGHNGVAINWRNSVLLHKAGFRDCWRELYPDPLTHPGATWPSVAFGKKTTTWTPKADERDRIDFIYHNGQGIRPQAAWVVGSRRYHCRDEVVTMKPKDRFALTTLPWPSDHKGVMVDFAIE
ncbi:MAG: endonuclease/exonuclease/phosphatase family protein [bacterium]|nr:endonuclease/exonuclease/phosphatase family protein [bacterium]